MSPAAAPLTSALGAAPAPVASSFTGSIDGGRGASGGAGVSLLTPSTAGEGVLRKAGGSDGFAV
jgi:hypothetical protein